MPAYQRPAASELETRLREPRRFLQVLTGPRQVGKTTLVLQVLRGGARPQVYVSADEPTLRDATWLRAQWERARIEAAASPDGAVLAVDEVQKVRGWSETVKRLWDEDSHAGLPLHVVLLGSSALLVQQGLTESLAGRFEVLAIGHWSFPEMRDAFGFTLEQYAFFGGYPGAAPLAGDPERWRRYVLDSLIETTVSRDILLITRVHKPALLRRLFDLGCSHSGQVLSYTKMLGQLQDAGNTTTLAHYLDLLGAAGLITGLSKFAGNAVRQRGSSPKLQVFNTALQTAISAPSPHEIAARPELRGRLIESLVGTHLVNASARGVGRVHYWLDRNREVDFVVRRGPTLLAIEVKSGRPRSTHPGLAAFLDRWPTARPLLVGGDGIPLEDFLSQPLEHWLDA